MIVAKWRSHAGDARARIGYLTGDKDSSGRLRPEQPVVLRGSTQLFLEATRNSWWRRHKFSESALAFGMSLPRSELEEIQREFEVVVSGGMCRRTYWLWVMHRSGRENHAHFLCLNQDLRTGNDFVPYYSPLDRDRIDTYLQILNTIRSYPNPKTRLKAREVAEGVMRRGKEVETLDARRGRSHLVHELRARGCTILAESSGRVRYVDSRSKKTCEVRGEPLKDNWIADPAKRLISQIERLQVRMDELHRRQQGDYGPVARIDVRMLPTVKRALALLDQQRHAADESKVATTPAQGGDGEDSEEFGMYD